MKNIQKEWHSANKPLRFYHRINTSNMYLKFMQTHRDQRQSNELTRGPPTVSSALSFIGGVHIGTRAPHVPTSHSQLRSRFL
jgi:hypothetical protein